MQPATLYRIYLGLVDKDGEEVDTGSAYIAIRNELARQNIKGATILAGQGLWKGKAEPCLIVELLALTINGLSPAVRAIGARLKAQLYQDAVLVVTANAAGVQAELIQ